MEFKKPKFKKPTFKLEKYGLVGLIIIACTTLVLTNHMKAQDAATTCVLAAFIIL